MEQMYVVKRVAEVDWEKEVPTFMEFLCKEWK